MNTGLRASLFADLFQAALVCALLFVPIVTQGDATFYGSGGETNTATNNSNVALGYAALSNNATGSYNTAAGYQALASNNGSYNTANGVEALFSNTTGSLNTATGLGALYRNTTGSDNTANGVAALYYNTTGYSNTANGYVALLYNTTGDYNTATGEGALSNNATGSDNAANGYVALYSNKTGYKNDADGYQALYNNINGFANTAEGVAALYRNKSGSYNIGLGFAAGQYITGNNNIDIGNLGAANESGVIRIGTAGTHNAAFLAGVNNVTISGGSTVYIDTNGQLGILPSSRRFKQDIKDMGHTSDKLMQLRPVTFRYNDRAEKAPHSLQYGLVAEEVAKVYPNLVQYDKAGKPFAVSYHLLTPMLLNELQKAHQTEQVQKVQIASLNAGIATMKAAHQAEIASLKAEVTTLKQAQEQQHTALAKLSALMEASQSKAAHQRTLATQP